MPVMKRYFVLKTTGETGVDSIRVLLAQLEKVMAAEAGVESLPEWPEGAWPHAEGRLWRSETDKEVLWELRARLQRHAYDWKAELSLGYTHTEMILGETWHLEIANRAIPYEDMPSLTVFLKDLKDFPIFNVDGLEALGVFSLAQARVTAFADFLASPTRRLPVVLVSPQPGDQHRQLARDLRDVLYGLSHVVILKPEAQETYREIMAAHPCFDGAVRLYMPGYQPTDKAWLHPFWTRTTDPAELRRELMDRIARESVLQNEPEALTDLRQRRDVSERRQAERLRRAKLEAEQQHSQAQQDIESWRQLAEDLERENKALKAENEELKRKLSESQNKVRSLRWQLNRQWESEEEAPLPTAPTGRIWLSQEARARYEALDNSERDYWDRHILPKLGQPEQRNAQREPVSSKGDRDCFVFPRGRSGDGRRVIYYEQDGDVYICELFRAAQHDHEYETLRNRGLDPQAYGDWKAWET
jgi:hypothetical protein